MYKSNKERKNRAISIYKLSRTDYKKLAHFQNGVSVLGRLLERGIKNWPISRTGYQFQRKCFLEGVPIWSRGRHISTHKIPKCPPPPPRALSQQPMRPRAKWAIESEAIRGRGIIIYCFGKIQLVGQKYRDQSSLAGKTRFSRRCFGFQIRCFLLVVGYNIQPSISSTNQNAVGFY